jgi:hypothetical protein
MGQREHFGRRIARAFPLTDRLICDFFVRSPTSKLQASNRGHPE